MRFAVTSRLAGGDVSHLDLRSNSLSWSEHRALLASAEASQAAAYEMALARQAIRDLQYEFTAVAGAVDRMEDSLALRLDNQAALLRTEIELLASIAESLRTPRATRAAERICDAGALLDDGRYERALAAANQAIDDDPTNRNGFVAAGWAYLGLERPEDARLAFREASQCGRNDDSHRALRQAARLTLLLEGPEQAIGELDYRTWPNLSPMEAAAAAFDLAVYNAATGNSQSAAEYLEAASREGRGFCLMALSDPILANDRRVVETAMSCLRTLDDLRRQVRERHEPLVSRLKDGVATLQALPSNDESMRDYLAQSSEVIRAFDELRLGTEDWGSRRLLDALDPSSLEASKAADWLSSMESYTDALRNSLTSLRRSIPKREVPLGQPVMWEDRWVVFTVEKTRLGRVGSICKRWTNDSWWWSHLDRPDFFSPHPIRGVEQTFAQELAFYLGLDDPASIQTRFDARLDLAVQSRFNQAKHQPDTWPFDA